MRYARPVRWEGQSPSLSLPLSRELAELLLAVDRGCESDRCEALPSAVPSGRVASWEFPGINPWAELCSPCGALQFGHFEKAAPGNFHDFFLFYNFLLAS